MSVKNIIQKKEITLYDFLVVCRKSVGFLRARLIRLLIAGAIGLVVGLAIAIMTPVRYIGRITFVVEETKGMSPGISALAGQFGFDLGGGGGSIFSGDNVFLFLKSEALIREALLTYYDTSATQTLADRYMIANRLNKKWDKLSPTGAISFSKYVNKEMPRLEDSLLQIIVRKRILKNDLSVSRPDKKASFVQLVVATPDEVLSNLLVNRIVSLATSKYVQSKIKVKAQNVAVLQRRADSLADMLNIKTLGAATNQQNLIDANPGMKSAPVSAEISVREKSMIATIFAEVVKNLELAKTVLSQETPAIQLVDQSTLPLEKTYASKLKYALMWSTAFIVIYSILLLFRKWLRMQTHP